MLKMEKVNGSQVAGRTKTMRNRFGAEDREDKQTVREGELASIVNG